MSCEYLNYCIVNKPNVMNKIVVDDKYTNKHKTDIFYIK